MATDGLPCPSAPNQHPALDLPCQQGMVAGGPWPDVVSYNTLIAAAAGSGNVRMAMRMFSDMVDAGGCFVCACLANSHVGCGCLRSVSDMGDAGGVLFAEALASLHVEVPCHAAPCHAPGSEVHPAAHAVALQSIRLTSPHLPLPPAEVEPTERTVGALLNCYAKARDAASARKVRAWDPSDSVGHACSLLVAVLSRPVCLTAYAATRPPVGFGLVAPAHAAVCPPALPTLVLPPPMQVFDSMSELGIPANVKIYTSLIDACVQERGDDWTEVCSVLWAEVCFGLCARYSLAGCAQPAQSGLGLEMWLRSPACAPLGQAFAHPHCSWAAPFLGAAF